MTQQAVRLVPPGQPHRVALYSHDTQGLGHIRRNIVIASSIVAASPNTDILLLTGNPEATQLPLPPNTDIITLPTIAKDAAGHYRSRVLNSPLARIVDMRSRVLRAAIMAFAPDLLIVDKVPLGLQKELLPTLRSLRASGADTQIVLGLREILDDPVTTVREWESMRSSQAIAEFYDAVWVYGDQAVYDPVVEYGLPAAVADKISYTGYLSHGRDAGISCRKTQTAPPPDQPYVLCLVGGGQDGFALADSFVSATMPDGHLGIVLTGPFMSEPERSQLRTKAAGAGNIQVLDFVSNAEAFTAGARAIISMAGYNSVCELLALDAATLLVPRTTPRLEQLIRASRLAELGLTDMLLPGDLSAGRIGRWLSKALRTPSAARTAINLGGLFEIPALASRMVQRARLAA